jgi:hypothetical protein
MSTAHSGTKLTGLPVPRSHSHPDELRKHQGNYDA